MPSRWFVHVAAEYYAETHIVEAETPEEAAALAIEQTQGTTYVRYEDDVPADDYASHTTPACAVMPFDDVIFIGSGSRVAYLREEES